MHYRSHVEFSFEALAEAAAGFARIENFLQRAAELVGDIPVGIHCAEFEEAHGRRPRHAGRGRARSSTWCAKATRRSRPGNDDAIRGSASSVRGMLAVLGCDPLDPHWGDGGSPGREARAPSSTAWSPRLLAQRTAAREARDFAAADAIRDQLKAAGVEIEDTPQGPQWSV